MIRFLQAEIGKDNLADYLNQLPKIDWVYSAPPNPSSIATWRKMANVDSAKYNYSRFIASYFDTIRLLSPHTVLIEVLENRDIVESNLASIGFDYIKTIDLTYSAPLAWNKQGMAKCRNSNKIVIASSYNLNTDFVYKYSHEFLDNLLKLNSQLCNCNCFDPCLGKGLLLRIASKYNCNVFGTELNKDRLSHAVRWYEQRI